MEVEFLICFGPPGGTWDTVVETVPDSHVPRDFDPNNLEHCDRLLAWFRNVHLPTIGTKDGVAHVGIYHIQGD